MEKEEKKLEENSLDFSSIVSNIDKVKKIKEKKVKKASISLKPLKFERSDEDSPLKDEIIQRINEKNLSYSDLYDYCTKLKNGNADDGKRFGYNIISGLRSRHTMIDVTFSMLCDFLGLDISLTDRSPVEDDDEEDDVEYKDEKGE